MSKVLVVEDEPAILRMIDAVLKDAGLETRAAEDAESAYQMIEEDPPDCVISDVRLPDKDGVELAHEIHQNEATSDLPVILISAYAEPANHEAERFIAKPFDIEELTTAVAQVCEGHAADPSVGTSTGD